MKKCITKALLLVGLVLLLYSENVSSVSATTVFTDIEGSYAKDAILELVEKGIITGDENGKFNPTAKINRQDFAIILAKSLQLNTNDVPATATFSDVPVTHYSYQYVEAAVKAELIAGVGEGKFGVDTNLNRETMASLFVKALGTDATGYGEKLTFADSGSISTWAKDAVGYAVEAGLMTGDTSNNFNPQGLADRQQVALVSSKFIKQAETLGIINNNPVVTEPPVEEPTPPAEEPTPPVEEPTSPVEEPTPPVEEPTSPVEEPTSPVEEPTSPVEEPTSPVEEPTPPTQSPIVETIGKITGWGWGSGPPEYSYFTVKSENNTEVTRIYYHYTGVNYAHYLNGTAVDFNTFDNFINSCSSCGDIITVEESELDDLRNVNVIYSNGNEEPQTVEEQQADSNEMEPIPGGAGAPDEPLLLD
ncbi:S-layer homology domain-containing protein [Metabacillus litoralis]|uniref:S-layer homology domain-containing protein n=1 Tax=Metabacillus litoralis TaxID=152268 RepID=UPI001B938EE5|nr:S-layer homology domain-containing protein [Metabacillus litoralis]UHA60653.1 S-layer homology domain-containing protein [Metabacillus litoralis]